MVIFSKLPSLNFTDNQKVMKIKKGLPFKVSSFVKGNDFFILCNIKYF